VKRPSAARLQQVVFQPLSQLELAPQFELHLLEREQAIGDAGLQRSLRAAVIGGGSGQSVQTVTHRIEQGQPVIGGVIRVDPRDRVRGRQR
jgi:hypothetical protein